MDEHLLTQQQMEAIQKNGFKTEMFGFHRAQVLSYLESLSQQYAQQEAELRARAEELQAQVLSAQNMLRESSARENALTVSRDEQARRVHMAQAETQAFRAELLSTREEIHTLHAKLEETEKSLTALQKERDELLASNDGMAAQLQQVRDSLAQQRARARKAGAPRKKWYLRRFVRLNWLRKPTHRRRRLWKRPKRTPSSFCRTQTQKLRCGWSRRTNRRN